jgi:hypothetical protein
MKDLLAGDVMLFTKICPTCNHTPGKHEKTAPRPCSRDAVRDMRSSPGGWQAGH